MQLKRTLMVFLSKDMTPNELFLSLVDNLMFDSTDQILDAATNLFRCKIVRFYKEDSDYLYKTFISNMQPKLHFTSSAKGMVRNVNIQEHEPLTDYTQKDLFKCSVTIQIKATNIKN